MTELSRNALTRMKRRTTPAQQPQRNSESGEDVCCCCGKPAVTDLLNIAFTPMCQRCRDEVGMLRQMKGTPNPHHAPDEGERNDL